VLSEQMSEPSQQPNQAYRPGESVRSPAETGITPAPVTAAQAEAARTPPVYRVERKAPPPENKDGFREIVETIVFVVVLVLLLKTFLAEAFVIPTGSMATTLLGYHKEVVCEQCKYPFKVNASNEVEDDPPGIVIEGVCPNCRFRNHFHVVRREGREK